MYEVELKFPLSEWLEKHSIADRLREIGAAEAEHGCVTTTITDVYYHSASMNDGDVFRIRTIERDVPDDTPSITHYLTVKSKSYTMSDAYHTVVKPKKEVELEIVGEHDKISLMVQMLGYFPIGKVVKTRKMWNLYVDRGRVERESTTIQNYGIMLDQLSDGRQFLEIELIVDSENDCDDASNCILELAKRLDLPEPERRSYFELVHGKKRNVARSS